MECGCDGEEHCRHLRSFLIFRDGEEKNFSLVGRSGANLLASINLLSRDPILPQFIEHQPAQSVSNKSHTQLVL